MPPAAIDIKAEPTNFVLKLVETNTGAIIPVVIQATDKLPKISAICFVWPFETVILNELPWVNPWYPRLRLRRVRNSSIHSRLKA